ncbi:MAG: protein of unknown function DUF1738 [uncultured bacterium]|nr:MAG: protein of unknown function DUF1738 [uncultured bacterium]
MNTYEKITNEIIEKIESEQILPWQKPWKAVCARNLVTDKPYRGFNYLNLNFQNFQSPYWMTFLQCKELGGKIKSGEKSTVIIFWKTGSVEDRETEEMKRSILLKTYSVFNLEQTEEIPENKIPKFQFEHKNPIEEAESIIRNFPNKPEIRFHTEDRAYYSPSQDLISIPAKESFKNQEDYFNTIYHEGVHSTGHSSRLNRKGITERNRFGSEEYSKEELIAELGAAFLCAESNILNKTINNSAGYLQSWLKALKSDPHMIIHASQAAEKSAKYILNSKEEEKEE